MEIKQIIIAARGQGRSVFDGSGKCVAGKPITKIADQATIAVKGTAGESISATYDAKGNCVAGDTEAVQAAVKGYPNAKIASLCGSRASVSDPTIPPPIAEAARVVEPLPSPPSPPTNKEATEGTDAAPKDSGAVDSGDNKASDAVADADAAPKKKRVRKAKAKK